MSENINCPVPGTPAREPSTQFYRVFGKKELQFLDKSQKKEVVFLQPRKKINTKKPKKSPTQNWRSRRGFTQEENSPHGPMMVWDTCWCNQIQMQDELKIFTQKECVTNDQWQPLQISVMLSMWNNQPAQKSTMIHISLCKQWWLPMLHNRTTTKKALRHMTCNCECVRCWFAQSHNPKASHTTQIAGVQCWQQQKLWTTQCMKSKDLCVWQNKHSTKTQAQACTTDTMKWCDTQWEHNNTQWQVACEWAQEHMTTDVQCQCNRTMCEMSTQCKHAWQTHDLQKWEWHAHKSWQLVTEKSDKQWWSMKIKKWQKTCSMKVWQMMTVVSNWRMWEGNSNWRQKFFKKISSNTNTKALDMCVTTVTMMRHKRRHQNEKKMWQPWHFDHVETQIWQHNVKWRWHKRKVVTLAQVMICIQTNCDDHHNKQWWHWQWEQWHQNTDAKQWWQQLQQQLWWARSQQQHKQKIMDGINGNGKTENEGSNKTNDIDNAALTVKAVTNAIKLQVVFLFLVLLLLFRKKERHGWVSKTFCLVVVPESMHELLSYSLVSILVWLSETMCEASVFDKNFISGRRTETLAGRQASSQVSLS